MSRGSQTESFARSVLERSRTVPVLVDFWAPWCGPCRVLGPVLERLAERANGRWELVKVNTEEEPEIARQYEVYSIPDVRLFVGGKAVDGFVGALPESQIERWLEQAIPISRSARYEQAVQRFGEGHCREAAELLAQERAAGVRDPEASLFYARTAVCSDPKAALEALGPEETAHDPQVADAIRDLGTALLSPAAPGAQSDARLARYRQGLELLREDRIAEAIEIWLGILEEERNFRQGELARIARALFAILGWRHRLTDRFIRRFSAAIHP